MVVDLVVELVRYVAVNAMNNTVITVLLKLLVRTETLLPAVVKPVVTHIKQHQRLHAAPGTGRKAMLINIVLIIFCMFWCLITIRALISYFLLSEMINFYYSNESGWDRYQQSIFETYPDTDPLKIAFKFWVWPISKVYPEYHAHKKGN